MRILLAGATGVIGARLVPLLVAAGHEVIGLTRSPEKVPSLLAAGVEARVVDILERDVVLRVVEHAAPDLVMHQVTDLPDSRAALVLKLRALGRVRTVGTDNLVEAAKVVGARVIAQSIAFAVPAPARGPVKHLEHEVLKASGLVLRYGELWGEGTWFDAPHGDRALHVDAAATATAAALGEPSGILQVLDSGTTRVG